MPTFEKAKRELYTRLAEVCAEYHPELEQIELKIGVVFAFATTNDDGEPTGLALSRGGKEVAWVAKVTDAAQRLTGSPDLLVKLNGDQWADWSEARQTSVLDEVLYAVEIVRDKETGNPESDDAGRPRIKLKKWDIDVQGFETIVRRHGEASLCRKALDHVYDRLRQQTLAFD